MAVPYNHKAIEKKWKEKWAENPVNPKVDENGNPKKKYYCLDMFPYPSGNGLHVGHWRGYVISDVWSRYKLLQAHRPPADNNHSNSQNIPPHYVEKML